MSSPQPSWYVANVPQPNTAAAEPSGDAEFERRLGIAAGLSLDPELVEGARTQPSSKAEYERCLGIAVGRSLESEYERRLGITVGLSLEPVSGLDGVLQETRLEPSGADTSYQHRLGIAVGRSLEDKARTVHAFWTLLARRSLHVGLFDFVDESCSAFDTAHRKPTTAQLEVFAQYGRCGL